MSGDLERPSPYREPAELAGAEMEPRVTIRLHRQRPGVAAFLAHFRDSIRPTEHEQRLDDAHVEEKPDPEDREPDPECPLPRVDEIEAHPTMCRSPALTATTASTIWVKCHVS